MDIKFEKVIVLYSSGVRAVHQIGLNVNQMDTSDGRSDLVSFPAEDLKSLNKYVSKQFNNMQCIPVEYQYTFETFKNGVPLRLFASKVEATKSRIIVIYASNIICDKIVNIHFGDFQRMQQTANKEVDDWFDRNFK